MLNGVVENPWLGSNVLRKTCGLGQRVEAVLYIDRSGRRRIAAEHGAQEAHAGQLVAGDLLGVLLHDWCCKRHGATSGHRVRRPCSRSVGVCKSLSSDGLMKN